jgi:hypothetical protein
VLGPEKPAPIRPASFSVLHTPINQEATSAAAAANRAGCTCLVSHPQRCWQSHIDPSEGCHQILTTVAAFWQWRQEHGCRNGPTRGCLEG